MVFNLIILFIPITAYMYIGYGRIYRSHSIFNKRWPDIKEMNIALASPAVSSRLKGSILRFKYLAFSYYILLALTIISYIYLAMASLV
ncbi:hypothetical protein AAEO56_08035 [Flavobacterium sp. DGU11]|uniref:DUF3899 domain-containing protein n=1 Tax=Flavobacterium arundinis TaxID=3139143 RepID=A0ABU9HVK0_9FLAO